MDSLDNVSDDRTSLSGRESLPLPLSLPISDRQQLQDESAQHGRAFESVEALGPSAWRYILPLQWFYEVGKEFQRKDFRPGEPSFEQIIKILEERDLAGLNRNGIKSARSSVFRYKKTVREFFRDEFKCVDLAPLFLGNGSGKPTAGLSEMGRHAWELTRRYLISMKIIVEETD
jgi:hypothetical protein